MGSNLNPTCEFEVEFKFEPICFSGSVDFKFEVSRLQIDLKLKSGDFKFEVWTSILESVETSNSKSTSNLKSRLRCKQGANRTP